MSRETAVKVRVLPERVLVLGRRSHLPGAVVELPAADAASLVERGVVEKVK